MVPGLAKLSYPERLRKLRLPTLSYRRYRGDMIEVFKITHGLYDREAAAGLLPFRDETMARGHKYHLLKRQFTLDIRKFSFANRVVDQWNVLPESVVESETVRSFEARLDALWKDSDVMYDPECELRKLTSSRKTRTITNTNNCAQPVNNVNVSDLMQEA